MANYDVSNPDFSTIAEQLTTQSPGHANTFNPLFSRLFKNDGFLKQMFDEHSADIVALQNMQICGKNLISTNNLKDHNCNFTPTESHNNIPTYIIAVATPDVSSNFGYRILNPVKISATSGTNFTLSFYYKILKYLMTNPNVNKNMIGYVKLMYSDGTSDMFFFNNLVANCIDSNNLNKWFKLNFTFTANKDVVSVGNFYFYQDYVSATSSIQVTAPMLVVGDKTTDWTPAIEDLENEILHSNEFSSYASVPDSNGTYTVVDYKRLDGTLVMKSTLSNGTSPNYTTDTWQFYDSTGTTIIATKTWTITYDSNGKVVSKVVA